MRIPCLPKLKKKAVNSGVPQSLAVINFHIIPLLCTKYLGNLDKSYCERQKSLSQAPFIPLMVLQLITYLKEFLGTPWKNKNMGLSQIMQFEF